MWKLLWTSLRKRVFCCPKDNWGVGDRWVLLLSFWVSGRNEWGISECELALNPVNQKGLYQDWGRLSQRYIWRDQFGRNKTGRTEWESREFCGDIPDCLLTYAWWWHTWFFSWLTLGGQIPDFLLAYAWWWCTRFFAGLYLMVTCLILLLLVSDFRECSWVSVDVVLPLQ